MSMVRRWWSLVFVVMCCIPGPPAAAGEGDAPEFSDARIAGTWTRTVKQRGENITLFMRLGEDGYQTWASGPRGPIPSESGALENKGGKISLKMPGGQQVEAATEIEPPDRLVLVRDKGVRESWQRCAEGTMSPGEISAGAGFSAEDRNDVEKCYDEAAHLFEDKEVRAAMPWFLRAAELGHVKAQVQLAWLYQQGLGTRRNFAESARWYRAAAEQGNVAAMTRLGRLFEDGAGVPEDWVEAARWYQQGALLGDAGAEAALARAFQFGIGVPQSRARSIEWYQRALQHGDVSCERSVTLLKEPKNSAGWRDDRERHAVLGGQVAASAPAIAEPAGVQFHDAAQRIAWLAGPGRSPVKDAAAPRK